MLFRGIPRQVPRYARGMNAEASQLRMTHTEYCALEREAELKHEYLAGEVFAMTGGTLEHSRLQAQLVRMIGNALEGGPCRVLTSDGRVRIEIVDADVYPDISVVCGEPQQGTGQHAVLNPTLVVEVLSKSTEAYDRGLKASYYRQIPSLRAYLSRQTVDHWLLTEAGPGQRLTIEELEFELDVDALYRGAFAAPDASD
jgi:Uma2 family endonuclease